MALAVIQDQMMTQAEAAQFLSLSPRTLEKWRSELTGPPYRKLGTAVRYKLSELTAWLDESAQAGQP
jgi:predicted DNA-binding transcriptional regulator AlpA